MKTYRMQWFMCGLNVGIAILSGIVMAVGGRIYHIEGVSWLTIVYCTSIFTVLLLTGQAIAISFFLVKPFRRIIQRLQPSSHDHDFSLKPSFRIRELNQIAQLLNQHFTAMASLAEKSLELLEKGRRRENAPQLEAGILNNVFERFEQTLIELEFCLEEMTLGHLFVEIPDAEQNTRLGQVFQQMLLEIRGIITAVREEVVHISSVSGRIAAMSQQSARNATIETRTIDHISSSIFQVAEKLRGVMQDLDVQSESLNQTFADIDDMLASIEQVNESVEHLSSSAEETSHSIKGIHEFMQEIETHAHSLATIAETVSTEATGGLEAVQEVITGIGTIEQTVQEAAKAIQHLGRESERIGDILDAINGIAEQTNLLALNASIIAAQAGEHGRGFAVVAGEVRELSERTRSSTQEIEGIIRSLQSEVTSGITAMSQCLKAVEHGVSLANRSETILQKIVQSFEGTQEMAAKLAQETVIQTRNSQQVKIATDQVTEGLGELQGIATKQAQDSTHLSEVATLLRQGTQHINQAAVAQLQETDSIAQSISDIQELLQRNAKMIHALAESSTDLGRLESHLAENIGHFFLSPRQLPADFQPVLPTIAFVQHGMHIFFQQIYTGIRHVVSPEHYQPLLLDGNDPVEQAEEISWVLQQEWLAGLILAPINEYTGSRLVSIVKTCNIPIVIVDFSVKNADVSVVSDNTKGGKDAADILKKHVPDESTVLVFGSRNLFSLACRMNGFCEQARSYGWTSTEIFSPANNIEETMPYILEGLRLFPNAQGVFLTNETMTLTYLKLLQQGRFPNRKVHAVGFDMTPEIEQAIAEGKLLGTIVQDPEQIGNVGARELVALLKQGPATTSSTPKELLIPVKTVTR